MNREHILIALVRMLTLTIAYSSSPLGPNHAYSQTPPVPNPVVEVIRSQNDALNRKDVNAYMATIHPDTPGYPATSDMAEKLFKTYDLRYTLEKTEILSMSESEATLHVIQTTEAVSGPEFRIIASTLCIP